VADQQVKAHQKIQKQKEQVHLDPVSKLSKRPIDPRYRDLTCYNCREPCDFVGICSKPKICFICVVPGYYMTDCQF
jgi:hypothetical protein